MSKRCHMTMICVLMVLLFSVTNAFAAHRVETFTISPFVGTYLFESQQNLKEKAVFGLAAGYNFDKNWTGEISLSGIMTEEDRVNGEDVDIFQGRFDVLYHFLPDEPFVPFLAAGAGAARISPDGLGDDTDFLFAYGGGFKFFFNESVAMRLEARHILDLNDEDVQRDDDLVHNLSLVAGLTFQLGRDRQEIVEYESVTEVVEEKAEPEEIVEVIEPEPVIPADSDNDGVVDGLDHCPETPAGTIVNDKGCEEPVMFVDTDGDGVSDALDNCPGTPLNVEVDVRGCPLPDTDSDGISDQDDRCPGTDPQFPVDQYGCPELTEELKIAGLVIEYATSQTGFSEEAAKELRLLAAKVGTTKAGNLIVEGHTDNIGSETYNIKLSQQRAEKVRLTLIDEFGVDPERVIARGYGPFEPVATNSTQEGRQQNRRVVVRYEP